jgi:hypothetical protein
LTPVALPVLAVRKVSPEAVTAVDSAGPDHHEEHPAFVFVQHSRHRREALFLQGIRGVGRELQVLDLPWQDLEQKWVRGVCRSHSLDESQRYAEGKVEMSPVDSIEGVGVEPEEL